MKKKNNINEMQLIVKPGDKVDNLTKNLKKGDSIVVGDGGSKNPTSAVGAVTEDDGIDAVIQPQDKATIKYLSNVIDNNTNEVSKPFTIDGKKYQMVHGLTPERQKVLAVFCHNDIDDEGNNVIHAVDHFEKTIAMPMMEKMKMGKKKKEEPKEKEELNLGHYKFFIVNEKTGKFRKLKTLEELAKDTLDKDEKFMGLKQFKKYFENKVFGSPKKSVNKENILEAEAPAAPSNSSVPAELQDDATILVKAKRLVKAMDTIPYVQKALNYLSKSKNYKEKTQALNAFLEKINISPNDVPKYLRTVKAAGVNQKQANVAGTSADAGTAQAPPAENELAPVGQAESIIITKAQLSESLKNPKIIKTIKVKDLK